MSATQEELWLHELASAALGTQHGARRLVIIVDQFEELLTARPQGTGAAAEAQRGEYLEKVWRPFVQNLAAAAADPVGPVSVIVTMRSDFLHEVARDADLAPLLADHSRRCLILPLNEVEVRSAIERPAVARGLAVDAALVEAVTQDFMLDPAGALPFLQEALLRVWQKGGGRRLSLAHYREIGGLQGAVNEHAESTLAELEKSDPGGRRLVRPLFVHLIRLADDGGADTKRRRPVTELPGGAPAQALALELAKSDCRLLVFDDGAFPGRAAADGAAPPIACVEIAHESLLSGWQNLKLWLSDQRRERLHLRRVEATARAWDENAPDARPELLKGRELRRAWEVCRRLAPEVPALVDRYLRRSQRAAFRRWALWAVALALVLAAAWWGAFYLRPGESREERKRRAELDQRRKELRQVEAAPRFDAPTAEGLGQMVIKLDPQDVAAWSVYGRALLEQGRFPQLETALAEWEKHVQPRPARIEELRGDAAEKQSQLAAAIARWSAALPGIEDSAGRRALRVKIVAARKRAGQWLEARDALTEWIRQEGDSLEVRHARALVCEKLQHWGEMKSDIEWAERNHPIAPLTYELLGRRFKNDPSPGQDRVDREQRDPAGWVRLALDLAAERKFDAALEKVEPARRLDPQSPWLKVLEGFLQWQTKGAIDEELAVVATWSREPAEAARVAARLEKDFAPVRAAGELLAAGEPSAEQYLVRGEQLARLRQHRLALEDFALALQRDPGSAAVRARRATSEQALSSGTSAPPVSTSNPNTQP